MVEARCEELRATRRLQADTGSRIERRTAASRRSSEEAVKGVYREWTRTGQCIFYGNGDEKLAVSDAMIVSTSTLYQQTPGTILAGSGAPVDPDATYLVKTATHMIWPYDDRGRLIGEDVWEYDDSVREFIPLDPIDVLTAEQSGKLLAPLIKPLPTHNPFTP